MTPSNKQHRQLRIALQSCIELDDILDRNCAAPCFSGPDYELFKTHCWRYAATVTALGGFYHHRAVNVFHFTVKSHCLIHIGLESSEISPRLSWCYAGEDFMGKIKKLVQSCSRGSAPSLMSHKVLEKYIIALSYSLMPSDAWWR